ncbi:hypothetical protein ACJX0J_015234 [Zea mays]
MHVFFPLLLNYYLFKKLGVKNSEVFLLFMDFYGICINSVHALENQYNYAQHLVVDYIIIVILLNIFKLTHHHFPSRVFLLFTAYPSSSTILEREREMFAGAGEGDRERERQTERERERERERDDATSWFSEDHTRNKSFDSILSPATLTKYIENTGIQDQFAIKKLIEQVLNNEEFDHISELTSCQCFIGC